MQRLVQRAIHAASVLREPTRRRSQRSGTLRNSSAIHAALLCCVTAAIGCAGSSTLTPARGFVLPLGREHGLSGRVFRTADHTYIDRAQFFDAIDRAQYLLLGETHDNRDHHQLQAEVLAHVLTRHAAAKVKVGFEMLDEEDAVVLARASFKTPAELSDQVAWNQSGWPEFALYQPVFQTALDGHAQLLAAHPSAEHVRASMQSLSEEDARTLHLDEPLPEAQVQAEREEIRQGHCGHGSDAMLTAMQRAQVYKDAFMARSLVQAGPPAVLIAGRGHVRTDRAVPFFLKRAGARDVVSVGLVDVDDKRHAPSDYDAEAFDYVIFTPRVSDEDPCEQFKKQLENMRSHAAE